jgi:hypothetical protein
VAPPVRGSGPGRPARSLTPTPREPNATDAEVVGKIVYLRRSYHFGPQKIAMYLKRYHDVTISSSGVWRILKRLGMSRLPSSQRFVVARQPEVGGRSRLTDQLPGPCSLGTPTPGPPESIRTRIQTRSDQAGSLAS